jgi:hypothetical protein
MHLIRIEEYSLSRNHTFRLYNSTNDNNNIKPGIKHIFHFYFIINYMYIFTLLNTIFFQYYFITNIIF